MLAPKDRSVSAAWFTPSPLASIGTAMPLPGTGAIIAMSVTGISRSAPIAASSVFTAGAAVLRSAHTAPGRIPRRPARNAPTAALELFTLSTRPAPAAASASLPVSVIPAGAGTAGS
jgi:hypothetical protein